MPGCECRYIGQAAVVAEAADIGQNGKSNASFSSKDPDTAATHFAGNPFVTLLERDNLAFLTAVCLTCQHWHTWRPLSCHAQLTTRQG